MIHKKLAVFSLLAALPAVALAADPGGGGFTGLMGQVTQLLGSSIPAGDESRSMLQQVLGSFVLDPFGQGGSSSGGSVLGAMFAKLNLFIFTVAMLWFSYSSWAALTNTMHEGVLLGQKMSTVWMPIRVTFGAVSLMPVFGGFAFCQALMMIAALLGIAGANTLQQTAIQSVSSFETLVNPANSVAGSTQARNLEASVLDSSICQAAANIHNAELNAQIPGSARGTSYTPTMTTAAEEAAANPTVNGFDSGGTSIASAPGTALILEFPTDQGTDACGRIELDFNPRGSNSIMGFRIAGVNYSSILSVALAAHSSALKSLATQAIGIANGAASPDSNSAAYTAAIEQLKRGYFGTYSNMVNANIASASWDSSAISGQLMSNMSAGGWATLGVWYESFAETNEAMNEVLDPKVTMSAFPESTDTNFARISGGVHSIVEAATGGSPAASSGATTATGNFSLGQWLFRGILNGVAGSNATGASQTLNPIIAFKNLGDNAIAIGETIFVVVKGAQVVGSVTGEGFVASLAAKATKFIPGVAGVIGSLVGDFASLLVPIGFVLFAAAAMMAFYIPLIPFISWFAALINWFVSVCESMAGASLWALAHFDAEGEGMGQRASYGYLFLFNNFARPIMLTLGFFFASAGVTVLGTFLFKYFGTAVANAQGNSITGLISIVAYLVIFSMMGVTLVNTMFNLTLHMADRVINFVGTGISSSIGHDVENRISGLFINAASRTGEAAGKRAAAGLAAGSSPTGAATGIAAAVRKATSKPGTSE